VRSDIFLFRCCNDIDVDSFLQPNDLSLNIGVLPEKSLLIRCDLAYTMPNHRWNLGASPVNLRVICTHVLDYG